MKRVLPLVYFLLVSLPHHPVSDLLDRNLIDPYGIAAVQSGAAVLFLVVFGFFLGLLWKSLKAVESPRTSVVLLWVVTLALVFMSDWLLIVNNIERIHFPQYAILAILLRLSIEDNVLIFLLSSFAGTLDEFLQYIMNPVRTNYLDFNDIALNILGAVVGVLFVTPFPNRLTSDTPHYEKKVRLAVLGVATVSIVFCLYAIASGRIVSYGPSIEQPSAFVESEGTLTFVLSYVRPHQFWTDAGLGRKFHIMTPLEGLVTMGILLGGYALTFRKMKHTCPPQAALSGWRGGHGERKNTK